MSGSQTPSRPRKRSKTPDAATLQAASNAVDHDQIRRQAYYKWEAAGCPCSDGVEFWLQAEAELADESQLASEASHQ